MTALSLTYTLTNGTTNDATQVEQDFTDILNYINGSVVRTDGANAMTAALSLSGDPTADSHAVRKAYTDGPYVLATNGTAGTWATNVPQVVKFGTKVDATAAYSTTTGLFTATKKGIYLASWTASPDRTNAILFRMGLNVNGTLFNGPLYQPSAINGLAETSNQHMSMPVALDVGQSVYPSLSTSANTLSHAFGEWFAVTWLHG